MSFAADVKSELCRAPLSRRCCAQAEAYGVLLYCNTFQAGQARIVTENEAFARRLPILFKKAFKLTFDRLPEGEGKQVFVIEDPAKLAVLHQTFGDHRLAQYAVTLGVGVPVKLWAVSAIDIGFEYGRRGYNVAERIGLVRQQYFKFSVGFSLFAGSENLEYWFVRHKYD